MSEKSFARFGGASIILFLLPFVAPSTTNGQTALAKFDEQVNGLRSHLSAILTTLRIKPEHLMHEAFGEITYLETYPNELINNWKALCAARDYEESEREEVNRIKDKIQVGLNDVREGGRLFSEKCTSQKHVGPGIIAKVDLAQGEMGRAPRFKVAPRPPQPDSSGIEDASKQIIETMKQNFATVFGELKRDQKDLTESFERARREADARTQELNTRLVSTQESANALKVSADQLADKAKSLNVELNVATVSLANVQSELSLALDGAKSVKVASIIVAALSFLCAVAALVTMKHGLETQRLKLQQFKEEAALKVVANSEISSPQQAHLAAGITLTSEQKATPSST